MDNSQQIIEEEGNKQISKENQLKKSMKRENFVLSKFSPKIEVKSKAKDYIIDIICFVLEDKELNEIKHKIPQINKFIIITLGRCSLIECWSKSQLDSPKINLIYLKENSQVKRSLCIKGFKISTIEKINHKAILPYFYLIGGLDNCIRIMEMISGDCIRIIQYNFYCVDFLIFKELEYEIKLPFWEEEHIKEEENFTNCVIVVGNDAVIDIFNLEKCELVVRKKIPLKKSSINVIEPIGQWKNNTGKNFIRFAIGDKNYSIKIWKIVKFEEEIKIFFEKIIKVSILWVLSIASFFDSGNIESK